MLTEAREAREAREAVLIYFITVDYISKVGSFKVISKVSESLT